MVVAGTGFEPATSGQWLSVLYLLVSLHMLHLLYGFAGFGLVRRLRRRGHSFLVDMDKDHILTKRYRPSGRLLWIGGSCICERVAAVSARSRRASARAASRSRPWHGVTSRRGYGHAHAVPGRQRWAAETRHGYYESLRLFYRWLYPKGSSPAEWLPVVPRRPGAPRPVPLDVLHEAVAAADRRTRLILCLGACAGLRASEIAAVHGRDVLDDGTGVSLMVAGKGGRVRRVPLADWLARAVVAACNGGGGWCFPSKYGGHLSGAHVSKLAAVVLRDGWTLHTLRHRFATSAYSAERDLLAVQRLLGHASVATTQRYADSSRGCLAPRDRGRRFHP